MKLRVRVAYVILIGGIVSTVIVACGSQSVSPDHSSTTLANHSGCWQGNVKLGTMPGALDFILRCTAARPQKVFVLFLTRSSPADSREGPGINAFRKFPPISGPGAVAAHARCIQGGYKLICQGRSRGRFEMHGRIWVKPEDRCSAGVALALDETPRHCSIHQFCPAVLITRPLAKGLPGGC
jgi:hypothetical protein